MKDKKEKSAKSPQKTWNCETPLRKDAFDLDDKTKISKIKKHFEEIMLLLGLDLENDSLKGTPHRVAKMYVKEVFKGLNPKYKPQIKLFDNHFEYGKDGEVLVQKNITFYSYCEHHFVPIIGKASVGYISSGKIIGLSKINRIVQYYAKRPQVQERLTLQITKALQEALNTESIAVFIEAEHLCVSSRGVQDAHSVTTTAYYGGEFKNKETKEEFINLLTSL